MMKLTRITLRTCLASLLCLCMVLQAVPLTVFAASDCEHTYDNWYYHSVEAGHYSECDQCNYYDEDSFEEHYNDDNDDYCDLCGFTVGHEHTYGTGYYYVVETGHYLECDQCAYYDEDSFEVHINDDADHWCDACDYYVADWHTFEDENYRAEETGHYAKCDHCDFYDEDSFEEHYNDDNDDYCDLCGFTVGHEHTYGTGYYYEVEAGHYLECDQCDYYDEDSFEAHINEEVDHYCDVCGYWVEDWHTFDSETYHTEENGHYLRCDNCSYYNETTFEAHVNEEVDHHCDVCGYWVEDWHTFDGETYYTDENGHYLWCDYPWCSYYDEATFEAHVNDELDHWCDVCGYFVEDWHTFDSDTYHTEENGHYLRCDNCAYYNEATFAAHVNEEVDHYCDVCGYWVEDWHTFDSDTYHTEENGHYLRCDNCAYYNEATFAAHINDEVDHYCDVCGDFVEDWHTFDGGHYYEMEAGHYLECDQCAYYDEDSFEVHINDDADHWCDACDYYVADWHTFEDENYRTEETGHYAKCDHCDIYDEDSFEEHCNDDNDDYCDLCGYTVGHEHTFDGGYYYEVEAGHYLECDQCDYYDEDSFEAHINDEVDHYCDVCDYYEEDWHTFDSGFVSKEPTYNKTGIMLYTCTACGYTKTKVIPATAPVEDATLIFRNDGALNLAAFIGAQFSVTKEIGEKYDRVYVKITHNSAVKTYDLTLDPSGVYFAEYRMAAKEMADAIDVQLYAEKAGTTYIGGAITGWTVKAKLIEQLDKYYDWMSYGGAYETTPKLCAAMLAYGAEAQTLFGYNTDNLATKDVAAKYLALVPTTAPKMEAMPTFNNSGKQASLYNPAFILGDVIKASLNFHIGDSAIENYKARVTINGVTTDYDLTQYVLSGTAYPGYAYIIIDSIAAADLRNDFSVTIVKGDTAVSTTYTFSMENMAAKLVADRTDIITAMMNYADAAHARFRAN